MPFLFRSTIPASATVCFAMLLALGGCKGRSSTDTPASPPKATEVGVVTLTSQKAVFNIELVGHAVSPLVAEIRPQVGGILQKRLFTEGSFVKAGQPLYQLDPSPAEATYQSAQANMRKAETVLATARRVAQRNAELVKIDAISKQLNEESQASAQQAEADLAVSRASAQTARINLGYTRIVSPISGWVELSTVTPGALVTTAQATALTTVRQLDPLYIQVTQSSSELLRLKRELATGRLQRDSANAARAKIVLEDGSTYSHNATLNFSGVTVDANTGTVTLRAIVPNPDGVLMPGMYVKAVLEEGKDDDALMIPQQALTRSADGKASTLVVGADNKVSRRPITVDRAIGAQWQVLSGLKVGERVIVDGLQRVRAGDTVRPVEVDPSTNTGPAQGKAPSATPASQAH